jgi:serine/threonine protein phosphatase 1
MKGVLARLLGRPRPAPSRVPDGALIYAIGDVHGRADLLDELLDLIARDAGERRAEIILLGDYVDRGSDSRGVIDRVLALPARGFAATALKGNHEGAMLAFLDDPASGPLWGQHGGGATLVSYGVPAPANRLDLDAWARASETLATALPPAHLAFLRGLATSARRGDYAFVHAGVRPGVPLAEQAEQDLLWIRDPFLSHRGPHEATIVHGHTPEKAAHLGRHRIGIDTGAYWTGRLTALRLEGEERRLLQTGGDA